MVHVCQVAPAAANFSVGNMLHFTLSVYNSTHTHTHVHTKGGSLHFLLHRKMLICA